MSSAIAQTLNHPALSATGVHVFCRGTQLYVSFSVPVLPADYGRPGLVFVGMLNSENTLVLVLVGDSWRQWTDGLLPAFRILVRKHTARLLMRFFALEPSPDRKCSVAALAVKAYLIGLLCILNW